MENIKEIKGKEVTGLEMRELRGDDLFTVLNIVTNLGIEEQLMNMFEQGQSQPAILLKDFTDKKPTKAEQEELDKATAAANSKATQLGLKMIVEILKNLKKVKTDINELLADLTGKEVSEIESLGVKEYTNLVIAFFKKEELKDFFISITSLMS